MVESVEKQLKAEIQKLLAEWKKTQDKETLKVLQGMTESLKNLGVSKRSREIHKETQEHNRAVRSHIERRAELRDKTRMGMPNIANIMAGGAESPIAGLGRMQRMASRPFKGAYEYQKSEGRIEELKGKKAKDRSKDEKDENLNYDLPKMMMWGVLTAMGFDVEIDNSDLDPRTLAAASEALGSKRSIKKYNQFSSAIAKEQVKVYNADPNMITQYATAAFNILKSPGYLYDYMKDNKATAAFVFGGVNS